MATAQQIRAAALVVQAIVETIDECPEGAPLGIIYAALMGMITYDSFDNVITSLVQAGVIRVDNHVAYSVKS